MMESLRIADNGRYFTYSDGTPFIWLADTAWTVPARLSWNDVQYYMKTRKQQGFTVLQMVVLDPECNPGMRNPCGIKALQDDDLLRPDEAYFSYVDWVLDQAEAFGFYVLLLPVWGELVTGWNWSGETSEKIVKEDNAYAYGSWLGERHKHRKNILWCLGGDRMPVTRGEDYRSVWRKMAEGLAKGITGKELHYDADREEWKKLLITYHSCHEAETGLCSTFSYWTPEDCWISFTMLQSGHGTEEKNYDLIAEERLPKIVENKGCVGRSQETETLIYPVWDGEPAYEMMPSAWPVTDDSSYHDTYMVRKRAYWALLAGAFGHTYGHASVWCTATQKDKNGICKYTWDEAVHSEGASQMKILRDFMQNYPLHEMEPAANRLLRQKNEGDRLLCHEEAMASKTHHLMLVYFAVNTGETIDVTGIFGKKLYGAWFDPKDGAVSDIGSLLIERSADNTDIVYVQNNSADGKDRVLILADDPAKLAVPSQRYGEESEEKAIKKVFEW